MYQSLCALISWSSCLFFADSWLTSDRWSPKEGPENCCLGSVDYQGNAAGESEAEIGSSFVIECPGPGVVPKLVSALILNSPSTLPLSQYIRRTLEPTFISVFDLFTLLR